MKNLHQISLLAVVLGFSLRAEEAQQQESSAKELMVIQPCPDWRIENTEKTWKIMIPLEDGIACRFSLNSGQEQVALSFQDSKQLQYRVIALRDTAHVTCSLNDQAVCSQEFKIEPPIVRASTSFSRFKNDESDDAKTFLVLTVTKSRE